MNNLPHPRSRLPKESLDQLFFSGRSYNILTGEVSDETLRNLYDLVKMGPTSANMSPARFVFVRSKEAKQKLIPLMSEGNQEKVRVAPVTVIIGHDLDFAQKLPFLFPHTDAKSWFEGAPDSVLDRVGLQNATLQGAYLIMAARSLGLDTGPMTGFDMDKASDVFFPNSRIRANMMVNIGIGDPNSIFERSPRLPFEEAVRLL